MSITAFTNAYSLQEVENKAVSRLTAKAFRLVNKVGVLFVDNMNVTPYFLICPFYRKIPVLMFFSIKLPIE